MLKINLLNLMIDKAIILNIQLYSDFPIISGNIFALKSNYFHFY